MGMWRSHKGRHNGRNAGAIVQVGCAFAYRGIPLQFAYCGAKHAIQGFTGSVRCKLLYEQSKVWITDGAAPRLECAPVPLAANEAGAQGAARAAHLPARGCPCPEKRLAEIWHDEPLELAASTHRFRCERYVGRLLVEQQRSIQ